VSGEHWQGYTKEAEIDQVRGLFAQRFGYEPAKVLDAKSVWLAGPIGEKPKNLLSRVVPHEMTKGRALEILGQLGLWPIEGGGGIEC